MKPGLMRISNIVIVGIFITSALAAPAAFWFGPTAHADAGSEQTVDINEPVNFDGSGSSGIGSLEYTWYYRDGTTETVDYPDPMHAFAKEGVYEVGLLIKDGNGYYDLDTVQITVKNEYPTAVAGTDVVVNEDETVHFDGYGSWDANNDIVTYEWDFGEGSTSNLTADSLVYERAGIYYVSLTVTDNDGAFDRDVITVTVNNVAPIAEGTASGETGTLDVYEDEPVDFDASMSTDTPSDLPLLGYAWDFGDTSSGAGMTTYHTYTKEGTYEVTLTVTDDDDDYSQDTITINVLNSEPVADAGQDVSVDEGSSLFLDGSHSYDTTSDESLMTYSWDFENDGSNDDIGWHSKNTWWDDGDHTTTLDVEDDDGTTGDDSREITVNNVDPLPGIFNYSTAESTLVTFSLRITGEKWHDVEMTLYEDDVQIGYVWLVRVPGNPNEQMEYINDIDVYADRTYFADIVYTPDDDPVNGQPNGANPCWLGLHLEDGNIFRFHRAFNYNKPDEWEWSVDLSSIVKVSFDAEIYDPGMDDIIFTWDFGDGSPQVSNSHPPTGTYPTKVADSVNHIYVLSTIYTVTLHAYDDDGGHDTFSCNLANVLSEVVVDNMAPRATSTANRTAAIEDEEFQFTGTGIDLLGNTISYEWNFDDGSTESGQLVNHSFADEGIYIVTLTVIDSFGASGKDHIFVTVSNVEPIANAGYNQVVYEDDTASFNSLDTWDTESDLNVMENAWDFGDGSKGEGQFASHVYTDEGTYVVTLTVTDNNGAVSTDTVNVTVINPAPHGLAIVAEPDADEDELVFFTGTATDTPSDEPLLTYLWDFGDGTTGQGQNPTHVYNLPGAFEVNLYVTDDDMLTAVKNQTVLITNVNPVAYAGPTQIELYGPALTVDLTGVGFDTASDHSSLTYSWWLGPGMIEYTPVVTMNFTATAIYDIRFKVEDMHLGKSTIIEIRIEFTLDSDGDCLSDEMEADEGTLPGIWDTDADNLMDLFEVVNYPTDPLDDDTDADLMNDWEEITFFGLTDPDEDGLQNPVDWDSDGEWIMDGIDPHPLEYDDTDGTILSWDAISVDNHVGYGVSVVMYGGSAFAKPSISPAVPPKPLESGIGIYANIQTTDTPPFSAQIRMRYDDNNLPQGMSEARLRMFRWSYSQNKWEITEDTDVDTTHNFVWAKVSHFSIFGIGDMATMDSDGDGINNWAEYNSVHRAGVNNIKWGMPQYTFGNPLYIKNHRAQFQIPPGNIFRFGSITYGNADLLAMGFTENDIATTTTWRFTDGGSFVYGSLSSIKLKNAQSASTSFLFRYNTPSHSQFLLYISGPTDPFDHDTDDDGLWDGTEVYTYMTCPIDPDTEDDGVDDYHDLDPLMDLRVSVKIKEILQHDAADGWLWGHGDFYVKIAINGVWYQSTKPGEGQYGHIYPNIVYTRNVPDDARWVSAQIQVWDYDIAFGDDQMDISGSGRTMWVLYDLRTGMWSGNDYVGDKNGFGHTSGNEDGSYGISEGDADVWFDIHQNDYDGDRLPFWQEVHSLGTSPKSTNSDTDGDGMSDWYEERYAFDRTNASDADVDADLDDLSNKKEYSVGTDPRLYELNLEVIFNWDVSDTYMNQFVKGMKKASDFIYDVTDGYLYFRHVSLADNKKFGIGWATDEGDIYVFNSKSESVFPKAGDEAITLPRYWNSKNANSGNPDTPNYYRTIAHEVGHFSMNLSDEYFDARGEKYEYPERYWPFGGPPSGPDSFMNSQYSFSEMTTQPDYDSWSPPKGYQTTWHYHNHDESCWETFFEYQKDNIWFDLDGDGSKDTSYLKSYTSISGPGVIIDGGYTKFTISNT